jgi:hypothetical protein
MISIEGKSQISEEEVKQSSPIVTTSNRRMFHIATEPAGEPANG